MKPALIFVVLLYLSGAVLLPTPATEGQSGSPQGNSGEVFFQLIKRANDEFNAARFVEAKKIYEEAVVEGKKAHVNKPDIAVALSDIAMVEKLTFHFEAAQDCLMDALPLAGDDQALLALLQTRLCSVMRARGNLYGAFDKAKSAVEIRRKIDAKGPQLAESLNNVAVLSLDLKNNKEAIDYCDQALAVLKEAGRTGTIEDAAVISTKAACLAEGGDYDGARSLLVQVLAIQEKSFGADSPKVAATLNNLAMTYCKKNQYKEAEPYLIRSLQLVESSKPQDIPGAADASANLADLYARMGDSVRADLNFKKAIDYCRSINYRHLADIKERYQSFQAGEIHPAVNQNPAGDKRTDTENKPALENKTVTPDNSLK